MLGPWRFFVSFERQRGTRPSTIPKLQARVKTPEEENGRLKRDYEVLLTACQWHAANRRVAEENRLELHRQQRRPEEDLWRISSVEFAHLLRRARGRSARRDLGHHDVRAGRPGEHQPRRGLAFR